MAQPPGSKTPPGFLPITSSAATAGRESQAAASGSQGPVYTSILYIPPSAQCAVAPMRPSLSATAPAGSLQGGAAQSPVKKRTVVSVDESAPQIPPSKIQIFQRPRMNVDNEVKKESERQFELTKAWKEAGASYSYLQKTKEFKQDDEMLAVLDVFDAVDDDDLSSQTVSVLISRKYKKESFWETYINKRTLEKWDVVGIIMHIASFEKLKNDNITKYIERLNRIKDGFDRCSEPLWQQSLGKVWYYKVLNVFKALYLEGKANCSDEGRNTVVTMVKFGCVMNLTYLVGDIILNTVLQDMGQKAPAGVEQKVWDFFKKKIGEALNVAKSLSPQAMKQEAVAADVAKELEKLKMSVGSTQADAAHSAEADKKQALADHKTKEVIIAILDDENYERTVDVRHLPSLDFYTDQAGALHSDTASVLQYALLMKTRQPAADALIPLRAICRRFDTVSSEDKNLIQAFWFFRIIQYLESFSEQSSDDVISSQCVDEMLDLLWEFAIPAKAYRSVYLNSCFLESAVERLDYYQLLGKDCEEIRIEIYKERQEREKLKKIKALANDLINDVYTRERMQVIVEECGVGEYQVLYRSDCLTDSLVLRKYYEEVILTWCGTYADNITFFRLQSIWDALNSKSIRIGDQSLLLKVCFLSMIELFVKVTDKKKIRQNFYLFSDVYGLVKSVMTTELHKKLTYSQLDLLKTALSRTSPWKRDAGPLHQSVLDAMTDIIVRPGYVSEDYVVMPAQYELATAAASDEESIGSREEYDIQQATWEPGEATHRDIDVEQYADNILAKRESDNPFPVGELTDDAECFISFMGEEGELSRDHAKEILHYILRIGYEADNTELLGLQLNTAQKAISCIGNEPARLRCAKLLMFMLINTLGAYRRETLDAGQKELIETLYTHIKQCYLRSYDTFFSRDEADYFVNILHYFKIHKHLSFEYDHEARLARHGEEVQRFLEEVNLARAAEEAKRKEAYPLEVTMGFVRRLLSGDIDEVTADNHTQGIDIEFILPLENVADPLDDFDLNVHFLYLLLCPYRNIPQQKKFDVLAAVFNSLNSRNIDDGQKKQLLTELWMLRLVQSADDVLSALLLQRAAENLDTLLTLMSNAIGRGWHQLLTSDGLDTLHKTLDYIQTQQSSDTDRQHTEELLRLVNEAFAAQDETGVTAELRGKPSEPPASTGELRELSPQQTESFSLVSEQVSDSAANTPDNQALDTTIEDIDRYVDDLLTENVLNLFGRISDLGHDTERYRSFIDVPASDPLSREHASDILNYLLRINYQTSSWQQLEYALGAVKFSIPRLTDDACQKRCAALFTHMLLSCLGQLHIGEESEPAEQETATLLQVFADHVSWCIENAFDQLCNRDDVHIALTRLHEWDSLGIVALSSCLKEKISGHIQTQPEKTAMMEPDIPHSSPESLFSLSSVALLDALPVDTVRERLLSDIPPCHQIKQLVRDKKTGETVYRDVNLQDMIDDLLLPHDGELPDAKIVEAVECGTCLLNVMGDHAFTANYFRRMFLRAVESERPIDKAIVIQNLPDDEMSYLHKSVESGLGFVTQLQYLQSEGGKSAGEPETDDAQKAYRRLVRVEAYERYLEDYKCDLDISNYLNDSVGIFIDTQFLSIVYMHYWRLSDSPVFETIRTLIEEVINNLHNDDPNAFWERNQRANMHEKVEIFTSLDGASRKKLKQCYPQSLKYAVIEDMHSLYPREEGLDINVIRETIKSLEKQDTAEIAWDRLIKLCIQFGYVVNLSKLTQGQKKLKAILKGMLREKSDAIQKGAITTDYDDNVVYLQSIFCQDLLESQVKRSSHGQSRR